MIVYFMFPIYEDLSMNLDKGTIGLM